MKPGLVSIVRATSIGVAIAAATGALALWLAPESVRAIWLNVGVPLGSRLALLAVGQFGQHLQTDGDSSLLLTWITVGAFITWALIFAVLGGAAAWWRNKSRAAI